MKMSKPGKPMTIGPIAATIQGIATVLGATADITAISVRAALATFAIVVIAASGETAHAKYSMQRVTDTFRQNRQGMQSLDFLVFIADKTRLSPIYLPVTLFAPTSLAIDNVPSNLMPRLRDR